MYLKITISVKFSIKETFNIIVSALNLRTKLIHYGNIHVLSLLGLYNNMKIKYLNLINLCYVNKS